MAHSIVLCVDSDVANLGNLERLVRELELPDFETLTFATSHEALEAAQERTRQGQLVAIVAVAAQVPGLPVAEFINHLRRDHPYLQAILLEPEADAKQRRKKGESVVNGHVFTVETPYEEALFLKTFREALLEWTRMGQLEIESRPIRELNTLIHSLDEMSALNSFLQAFLSALLRQTNATRAIYFTRSGDSVKIEALVAEDHEENMALQKELQTSVEGLTAKFSGYLTGSRAEFPTRLVLNIRIMNEHSGYVLVERPETAAAFDPMEREAGRLLASHFGQLETSRILRNRSLHDRKALERARRDHAELEQLSRMQFQTLDSSIRYARMVTQSTLPAVEELHSFYEDAFIVFRPRDVVSGAFYWFGERYYKFMIAIADTRVPGLGGAFLSLLHHRIITEVSNKSGMPKPRAILLDMNDRLKEEMKELAPANAAMQGLRIGLVSIDESVQVLRYAGADIPIWVVRNGEVKRLNSGTLPLGQEPFPGHKMEIKQHTFQLSEEDRVYVTTPGLLELRGGHDNSAFGADRFRKLLQDVALVPFQQQQQYINRVLDEWLDGHQASHDVLLCGLQLASTD
jgi:serine phosphatase RsbU (regulator of sigma subunit)